MYLCAYVNPIDGKQKLIMQKINLETNIVEYEDKIECIHTAICDIPVEEFEDIIQDEKFEETIIKIRSSEGIKEINLEPEEKFKALKSWVAGIAEAGVNAFQLQADIDMAANLAYPIMDRLLRFMMMVDSEFIGLYLRKIEKDAWYEGELHKSYLMSSLIPLLGMISRNTGDLEPENEWTYTKQQDLHYFKEYRDVLNQIFSIEPPLELFTKNSAFSKFLVLPEATNLANFKTLFNHPTAQIRRRVAQNHASASFNEYRNFLSRETEKNDYVRAVALRNPAALKWLLAKNEAEILLYLQNLTLKYIPKVDDCRIRNGYVVKDKHIVKLNLKNMGLKHLPERLSELIHLEYAVFSHNELKYIPQDFCRLKKLKYLDFSHNSIDILSENINALNKLQRFDLSYNRLYYFPNSLQKFDNLEVLLLNRNHLSDLPESLFGLTNLKILDFSYNNLKFIPPTIKKLKRLEKLLASHNKIKIIPEELINLENLRIINFNNNSIEAIPFEIDNIKNLKMLYLYGNGINQDVLTSNSSIHQYITLSHPTTRYQSCDRETNLIYRNYNNFDDFDYIFNKIVVFGAGGVGKTSLMYQYFNQIFNPSMEISISPEFFSEEVIMDDFLLVNQYWDFPGVSRLRFLADDNLKGTTAVILCYDLSRFQTFKELEDWYALVLKNLSNPLIYLIGIKSDSAEKQNISSNYYNEWISTKNIAATFECSAKTGHNVKKIFKKLSEDLISRWI